MLLGHASFVKNFDVCQIYLVLLLYLGVTPTTAFKNDRYLVCFNQTTGDLITGDKQRRGTINKFDQTNKIGSKKWIDKWSKE